MERPLDIFCLCSYQQRANRFCTQRMATFREEARLELASLFILLEQDGASERIHRSQTTACRPSSGMQPPIEEKWLV